VKKKRQQDFRTKHADNPLVQAFAQRLKKWRQGKGLTLAEVSADTGFSTSVICEWENGHRFPAVLHLTALAEHTGISASNFIRPLTSTEKKTRSAKGR